MRRMRLAQHVTAGAVGAVAVERDPARAALDLQRGGHRPEPRTRPLTVTRLPVSTFKRFAAHADLRGMRGFRATAGRRRCRREAQRAGAKAHGAAWIAASILLWCTSATSACSVTATPARVLPARARAC